MSDRIDRSSRTLFATYPQKAAPVTAITDTDEATHTGHYATAAELLEAPETRAMLEHDPLYAEPERFIAGYLASHDVVGLPQPLPGPVSSWPVAYAAAVLVGYSFIPSAACTVQLFDGPNASGVPLLQLPIPVGGAAQLFSRILFPHGLSLLVTGGATVQGGVVLERRVDSIPK